MGEVIRELNKKKKIKYYGLYFISNKSDTKKNKQKN